VSEKRPQYDVIFDATGGRIARVRLPAGSRLVGFGPASVYSVRKDGVGLEWLDRYDTGWTS